MTTKERIENAIRHIQTATDVDPWAMETAVEALKRMIPIKPKEGTDSTWSIRSKVALCPKCEADIGRVLWIVINDAEVKEKVTYCGACGQAIDWEGWEWDE